MPLSRYHLLPSLFVNEATQWEAAILLLSHSSGKKTSGLQNICLVKGYRYGNTLEPGWFKVTRKLLVQRTYLLLF